MAVKNTGFIHSLPNPRDWRSGSITGIKSKVLSPTSDWQDSLPVHEQQLSKHFDTMACVSFSALNCIEIYIKKILGIELNFSDRFTAKVSNTTKRGNTFIGVAGAIRDFGLIFEDMYNYPRNEFGFDWDDYYKAIDKELYKAGEKFLEEWEINHEWVKCDIPSEYIDALKYSPLQVSMNYASSRNKDENGIIQPTSDKTYGHAVVLIGFKYGEYWLILDHYSERVKKISWDYPMSPWTMRYVINKKGAMQKPRIENDTLVQLIEGEGGFGYYLDGQIIVDDLSKLLATDRMRNKNQSTITLKQAEWDLFDKVNLKGESI